MVIYNTLILAMLGTLALGHCISHFNEKVSKRRERAELDRRRYVARRALLSMRAESQDRRWKADPFQYLRDIEQGKIDFMTEPNRR